MIGGNEMTSYNQIVNLYLEGKTIKEIAEKLYYTWNHVYSTLRLKGVLEPKMRRVTLSIVERD